MDKKFHEWGGTDGDITKVWSHKHDYPIEEIWNTDNNIGSSNCSSPASLQATGQAWLSSRLQRYACMEQYDSKDD